MKTRHSLLVGALLAASLHWSAPAQAQSPIGGIMSYQGKFTDITGVPVPNGTYSVTFKIYENSGATPISSQAIPVAVLGGVFSTFLSIGTTTFDPAKSYELGVQRAGSSEQKFTISSVPVASTVPANAITSAKIADGTIANADLADSSINSRKIADKTIAAIDIADGVITDAKMFSGVIPIGGVMMWWSDGTTTSLPNGWTFCDGSTLNNAASPLNGRVLPNLTDRFVRGIAPLTDLRTNPVSGGADTINLTHSHVVGDHTHSIPRHDHTVSIILNERSYVVGGAGGGMGGAGLFNYRTNSWSSSYFVGANGPDTINYAVAGNGPSGPITTNRYQSDGFTTLSDSATSGGASPGTDTALSASQSILPSYVGLVYIIRVL